MLCEGDGDGNDLVVVVVVVVLVVVVVVVVVVIVVGVVVVVIVVFVVENKQILILNTFFKSHALWILLNQFYILYIFSPLHLISKLILIPPKNTKTEIR